VGSSVMLNTQKVVDELYEEFDGLVDRAEIERLMNDSLDRLGSTANVPDFVPLMAQRFTWERLNAMTRRQRRPHGTGPRCYIVFVSLSGGGRGQIAAALTTLLSGGAVSVHSAGTAANSPLAGDVRSVIAELGVDPAEAFARPVTDEVLQAADVVVTMGHSVGDVELPSAARHEDWRVGDPTGAPIEEIRRVRGDIEYRVRGLLHELGIPVAGEQAAAEPAATH